MTTDPITWDMKKYQLRQRFCSRSYYPDLSRWIVLTPTYSRVRKCVDGWNSRHPRKVDTDHIAVISQENWKSTQ
jgi:hypothetical protein